MLYYDNKELYHHGILGMKWGIRRYQNPDGSLTEEGKRRYLVGDGRLNKKGIDRVKKGLRSVNLAWDDYNKAYSKYEEAAKNANTYKEKYEALMKKTVKFLEATDYTLGYNYYKDNFYMKEVPVKDLVSE